MLKKKNGRIELVFKRLQSRGHKAFIPFITGGFPDWEKFKELFLMLDRCGADIIEIGVPFSDPLADGPVVQDASMIALKNKVNADQIFQCIRELRARSRTPIALMTYFNIVYGYGLQNFLSAARHAGVDGMIIPDLPLEEFYGYKKIFRDGGIDNIMLVSLNSDTERMNRIAKECSGFLYCVSVKGVTGVKNQLDAGIIGMLQRLKKMTALPLCPGFGISEIKQIEALKEYADGMIIGSKLLSMILECSDFKAGLKKVEDFVKKADKVLKRDEYKNMKKRP